MFSVGWNKTYVVLDLIDKSRTLKKEKKILYIQFTKKHTI